MTTNCAFFCSTREVTELMPNRSTGGLLVAASSPVFCRFSARSLRRAFFFCFVSGLYLSRRRNRLEAIQKKLKLKWYQYTKKLINIYNAYKRTPVWRSSVCVNWLMVGGTLRRLYKIACCRCNRMYFGHLTKCVKSRFGWMSWPMPKFFGRRRRSGLGARRAAEDFFAESAAGGPLVLTPPGLNWDGFLTPSGTCLPFVPVGAPLVGFFC